MSKYIEKDLVQQTAVLAMTHNWTMNQIYTALMILPSEDMIRCEDCRYWTEWGSRTGSCQRSDSAMWLGTDATDFCSFAERKDDEVHKNG